MYEFPSAEGHLSREEVLALKEKGMHPSRISRLPDSRHVFSLRNGNDRVIVSVWMSWSRREAEGRAFICGACPYGEGIFNSFRLCGLYGLSADPYRNGKHEVENVDNQ